jgi:diguanylate cyclase (GGDEF)-like protein/PAS domain S-box-containing protein
VKALVVHQDAVRREALARLLGARGHHVEALAAAEQIDDEVSLVLLGWTDSAHAPSLVQRWRRDARVIVVVSPRRAHADYEAALAAGAAQVLIEPVDREQLWSALVSAEYLALERLRSGRAVVALRHSAERFRSLVQNALDIIAVLEPDTTIRYVSPAVRRVLEYEPHELVGRKLAELVHDDDVSSFSRVIGEAEPPGRPQTVEVRVRHKSGEWRYIEAIADRLAEGIVVNGRDVTDRHELEEMLAREAFYDNLTGLANRALFMDRLVHALAQAERRDGAPALLFVDLDGFKKINDRYGHDVGDAALAAAARRLLECRREGDTAARLGGDEFTLLVESIETRDDARRVAERVLEAMRQPLDVGELSLPITVSVGVSYSEARIAPRELVRRADAAMYRAKELGKNRYAVWDAEHDALWPRSTRQPTS